MIIELASPVLTMGPELGAAVSAESEESEILLHGRLPAGRPKPQAATQSSSGPKAVLVTGRPAFNISKKWP
jgi:hypothetical protein